MKSSSTGKENISLTSPIISACFTVSIPSSPSRSWSISMKSSGYPVCFTTTEISFGWMSLSLTVATGCLFSTSSSSSISTSADGSSEVVTFSSTAFIGLPCILWI